MSSFRPVIRQISSLFLKPRCRLLIPRQNILTGNPNIDRALTTVTGGKIEGWLKSYENFVGLTEVREAQNKVIQAEKSTLEVQSERREKQQQVLEIQNKLRNLSAELEKVNRGEERYLTLLTEEYRIIKEENLLNEQIRLLEQEERARFAALSSAVRESHEKERVRTERTKYWSIIGSIIGAAIGIMGTSINNYYRMRELRGIVADSAEGGTELRGLVAQLSSTMQGQHNQLGEFLSDLRNILTSQDGLESSALESAARNISRVSQSVSHDDSLDQLEKKTTEIMDVIRSQDVTMQAEMKEIKEILAISKAIDSDVNVIYVGPEMEGMLENTERNLEWRMKINAIWTVTLIYGAFALTLPALYNVFK